MDRHMQHAVFHTIAFLAFSCLAFSASPTLLHRKCRLRRQHPLHELVQSVGASHRLGQDATIVTQQGRYSVHDAAAVWCVNSMYEKIASSTKPEAHNVLQRDRSKTEPWLQMTCVIRFGEVWTCGPGTGSRTDRQTQTDRHAHHNTSLPHRWRCNCSSSVVITEAVYEAPFITREN